MRIGVDVGGTFTDLVAVDEQQTIHFLKVPSTPGDPSEGVINAINRLSELLNVKPAELSQDRAAIIHGTTVATNILVQQNGSKLGLITTKGFKDLIELRDGSKAGRYNLRMEFPEPIIPRPLRLEVLERTLWDGSIATPIDIEGLRSAIEELKRQNIESLVVCFLHSHRNPGNELACRKMLNEVGLSIYATLSHEVLKKEGEYERLSTAIVNSYVGPGLSKYLHRLESRLAEGNLDSPLLVMQSNGGVLPVADASRLAVGAVTSGPAGGAMASALLASSKNLPRLVAYDMGGTTTDISLIEDGRPVERQRTEVAGLKIGAPALDVSALGIGGGSIARIDPGGILELGPMSAGAEPGPACYSKGGVKPTVTDANIVLGYLSADVILGGKISLSKSAAAEAIIKHVATPLNISLEESSYAISLLASTKIAQGIRVSTIRRGKDPRDYALLSFGGAGGIQANAVAFELGVSQVIVPRQASVMSALGFLATDVRADFQRSVGSSFDLLQIDDVRRIYSELREDGTAFLRKNGFADKDMCFSMEFSCRYARQIANIPVPLEEGDLDATLLELREKFEQTYLALYQHSHPDQHAVIDSCRIAATGIISKITLPTLPRQLSDDPAAAERGKRKIYIGRWADVPVYWFDDLRPGMRVVGPALIDSSTTSCLVLPGSDAEIDDFGNICISINGKKDV